MGNGASVIFEEKWKEVVRKRVRLRVKGEERKLGPPFVKAMVILDGPPADVLQAIVPSWRTEDWPR